jgi:hypothetical protein
MSYLDPVRLHFSGRFQADVSTVNNDPTHFNNATFKPEYQQPQDGRLHPNGWWNPDGSGSWRLVECKVRRVCYADGSFTESSSEDPTVGQWIADSNQRVAGKLVDLDPEQQVASQIWGMIVRLTADGQTDLFKGPFAVTPFSDIWWARAQGSGAQGDVAASAFYQSIIGPVQWGDVSGSRFLQELKRAAPDGLLSIKFNVDGYSMGAGTTEFTMGRIVGTIGPASPQEPRHFVLGRHLLARLDDQNNPADLLNFMPAAVSREQGRVLADFGNAVGTTFPGGPVITKDSNGNPITLELGYLDPRNGFQSLGTLDYTQEGWYERTAGVQAFPPDRRLTEAELTALESCRLAVTRNGQVALRENDDGQYARADQFVQRVSPDESVEVDLWVTQFGKPLENASVLLWFDSSGLQGGKDELTVGVPESALSFSQELTTGPDGKLTVKLGASDPGNPRQYIDGQVYGVRYLPKKTAQVVVRPDGSYADFGWNPSDFISVLVWSAFTVPQQPTWYGLQPIFQQYANLYPLMGTIVDLSRYESVAAHANILSLAFGLPPEDPNYMPATRDLSASKRQAILQWLRTPGADGKPVLGTPPALSEASGLTAKKLKAQVKAKVKAARAALPRAEKAHPAAVPATAAQEAAGLPMPGRDSKTFAMAQRKRPVAPPQLTRRPPSK